jgi:hypothetical protein
MNEPAAMTSNSTATLSPVAAFFEAFASDCLTKTKSAILMAKNYRMLLRQLRLGRDLGSEFPDAKKLGPRITQEVVEQALKEFEAPFEKYWLLPLALNRRGTFNLTYQCNPFEHLPRFQATYTYTYRQAKLCVEILTAGENISVELRTEGGKGAIDIALKSLEQQLTLAALS